jgi:hypothetical protein
MINFIFYNNFTNIKTGSGSGHIRANQIFYIIQQKMKNINFKCITNINNIKNSYILCIKHNNKLDINKLKLMKKNNNKIIFDILDYYEAETLGTPDIIKNGFNQYINIFVVNNEYMKNIYKNFNKPIYVIPHHYDIRLNDKSMKKLNDLKFIFNGYVGYTNQNCLYIKELQEKYGLLVCDEFNKFCNRFLASNYCFISIRKEGTWEYNNRPCMKLAHAAACESNIIITNDMSVRDLLDPSYPYLLKNHEYETVLEMMEYVKKTFETDIWYKGLEIIKDLKQKLKIEQVVDDYWVPMIKEL